MDRKDLKDGMLCWYRHPNGGWMPVRLDYWWNDWTIQFIGGDEGEKLEESDLARLKPMDLPE
jgi:hypothetical protein